MMAKKHYLNDFKRQEDGKYAYEGKHYIFDGDESERKRAYSVILLLVGLMIASVLGSGFLTGGGMKNSYYVILPYLGEAVALFFSCWYIFKLMTKGDTVREYIYRSTVMRIPGAVTVMAFFASAGLVCSLIFGITSGFKENLTESIIYLIIKAFDTFIALLLRSRFSRLKWIEL